MLAPMSIALVLRLFWVASLEKMASRNLALASGPAALAPGAHSDNQQYVVAV